MALFRREGEKLPEVIRLVTIPDEEIDRTRFYEWNGKKYDQQFGLRIDVL